MSLQDTGDKVIRDCSLAMWCLYCASYFWPKFCKKGMKVEKKNGKILHIVHIYYLHTGCLRNSVLDYLPMLDKICVKLHF